MDSNKPQQANSNDVSITSDKKQLKGPEDLVVIQIMNKTRDALKGLKKYRRETNAEVLDRVVGAAVIAAGAAQESPVG